jgi:acyl-CoA oxidase
MVSGIPSLYTTSLAKVAYDGDNSILALQAIKYLISLFNKKPPKEFEYIYGKKIVPQGNPSSGAYHQQCFEAVAQWKMQKLHKKYLVLLNSHSKDKIWNDFLQVEGIDATESVFYANIHMYYYENSQKVEDSVNKEAIEKLRLIFAASELEKYEGILLHLGVSAENLDFLRNEMINSLKYIRNHALGLIEAFELNDETLNSILGRKDGRIYENMLAYAKKSNPINAHKVFPGLVSVDPKL